MKLDFIKTVKDRVKKIIDKRKPKERRLECDDRFKRGIEQLHNDVSSHYSFFKEISDAIKLDIPGIGENISIDKFIKEFDVKYSSDEYRLNSFVEYIYSIYPICPDHLKSSDNCTAREQKMRREFLMRCDFLRSVQSKILALIDKRNEKSLLDKAKDSSFIIFDDPLNKTEGLCKPGDKEGAKMNTSQV